MAKLILMRHGISEWNKLGKWTGWTDIELAPEGEQEATRAGQSIDDINIDLAYTAPLKRTRKTLQLALAAKGQGDLPYTETESLLERNYGVYTGKNKWEVKEELGDDEFQQLRRGWDYPIPEGEMMKTVYERVVKFYLETILPELKAGKNVIISASGNSCRALVMFLDKLTQEELVKLEVGLGEVHIYDINEQGEVMDKEIRAENKEKGNI